MSLPPVREGGNPSRYLIETWGCQMNEHDSERMAGILAAQGMEPARGAGDADIILLNTCAVREKASDKVFSRLGHLGRLKRRNPELVIGVCGCVAQMEQEVIFKRAPHVDLVMGPRHLGSLSALVGQARHKRHQLAVLDPRDALLPEEAQRALRTSRTKAYITIMEGCNKACTFCIVPTTRGRESCRSPEAILDEARAVVSSGFLEIEILGQNVNAYRSPGWDFTRLLGSVARIPGLRRLRFTTSHPLHFKNSIPDLIGASPVLCPHVHLPFQSGSNRILKEMRRGYTREEFLSRISYARSRIPGLALSTDIIAGFPGETEEEFEETLAVVREVRFHQIYAFVYSSRPGTPAAGLEDGVAQEVKLERLHRLMEIQQIIQNEVHGLYVGQEHEVLVEGPSTRNPELLSGRTPCNRVVVFEGPVEWTGRLMEIAISGAGVNTLRGKALQPGMPRPPLTSPDGGDITEFGRTLSGEMPS